jgi:Patatin-like phospholipase
VKRGQLDKREDDCVRRAALSNDPLQWEEVFAAEIEQIRIRRTGKAEADCVKKNLVGLALSGGGIRSATFGLGVLEGLKRSGLLKKVDYLSTVSGGGYIGAWLSANCKRAAEPSLLSVHDFNDLSGFVAKLRARKDPISDYLWKHFSVSTLEVLISATSSQEQQELALVRALNNVLKGVSIYEVVLSASVALSRKTLALKSQNPQGTDLIRFNRLLLEDAYPLEVAKGSNWLDKGADWTDSIAHLRRYSNYLSPRLGFFSADTWSMFTIWLRNTLLVQLIVGLAIAAVLLLPRLLFEGFKVWPGQGNWRWTTVALFILSVVGVAGNQLRLNRNGNVALLRGQRWPFGLAVSVFCLGAAWQIGTYFRFEPFTNGPVDYRVAPFIAGLLLLAGFYFQPVAVKLVNTVWPGKNPPEEVNYNQNWVQGIVVLPIMATGYLVAAILWRQSANKTLKLGQLDSFGGFFKEAWEYWPLALAVAFFSLWLLSFCSIRSYKDWKGLLAAFFAPFFAIVVLHALLCALMLLLRDWVPDQHGEGQWLAFIWAPPVVLCAIALSVNMLIGIMGRQSVESVREWWSRLGAWLAIYGFAWTLVAVAAIYGPLLAAIIVKGEMWARLSVGGGWLASTVAGLLAGKSGSTGNGSAKTTTSKILELIAKIAPFVFIAGLLIGVSVCLQLIILSNSGANVPSMAALDEYYWVLLQQSRSWVVWVLLTGVVAGLLVMALRVDINVFSLNAFYRNRLVRCYLGATRYLPGERNPQNFTGFDEKDDLRMADLQGTENCPATGPLHLVNCALNLGGSSDLALHTRHSASFTMSPYATGSGYSTADMSGVRTPLGFRSTAVYGGNDGQPTLGQAISVSGAAASPNMGYHTSPVVAFLLTVFNARLGWWFANPRTPSFSSSSPAFSLPYLFKELFGAANEKSDFLMISDGGHFENLAVYELIRRRCRVIIVSDAECDPLLQFEGLGTLIRMCEVDLGARITLDVGSIRHNAESDWSTNRCAVGTIDYMDGPRGILIYLKASMTGHEDSSVLQYKASHPTFPHESTGNQFYGEDQFESYRRLGEDVARRAFESVSGEQDFAAIGEKLLKICSPALGHIGRSTQHSSRLMDLWRQLGAHPNLEILHQDFEKLLASKWPDDASPDSFRTAYYMCSQMLQLMESVYLDLRLDDTWDHPDNEGWRNVFLIWSKSAAMQKTWSVSFKTFGLRFQYFCARRLGLSLPGQGGEGEAVSSASAEGHKIATNAVAADASSTGNGNGAGGRLRFVFSALSYRIRKSVGDKIGGL